MEQRLQELRQQFFKILDDPASASIELSLVLWDLFARDPWYQRQLHVIAHWLLRRAGAPSGWAEDVKQDAMVLLGQHLRHAADTHVDRARTEKEFRRWLSTIITHDCQQALRRKLHQQPKATSLAAPDELAAADAHLDELIDFGAAMEKLPDRIRAVLTFAISGWSTKEIAVELHLSIWQVGRALHRGGTLLTRDHE